MALEQNQHYNFIGRIFFGLGKRWLNSYLGKLFAIIFKTIGALLSINVRRFRTEFRQIVMQVYFTGVEALSLIAIIATVLGTLTITQALTVMPKVGFTDFFGNLMVIIIVRELGPVLTAFLIAGRTGSALAAYVGNMKVESEVDALETMGIDPIKYLIMPAMVGGIIALIILSTLFSTIAIVVGFLVAKVWVVVMQSVLEGKLMWGHYLNSILLSLKSVDFIMLIIKPLVFGALIASNACLFGMNVEKDIREVPKSISRSVVYSFITIIIADLVLSLIYFVGYMQSIAKVI